MVAKFVRELSILIHVSLVFVLCVYSFGANSAVTANVSPLPGYAGEVFTFSLDLGGSANAGYTINLELGDGGGGWLDQGNAIPNSGRDVFSLARQINQSGIRKYRYAVYDNGVFAGRFPISGDYYTYTVLEKSDITITSVSAVSPQSAVSGNNFTFRCTLSGSLPSGYGVYLNFDNSSGGFLSESSPGGHVSMGTDCLHTTAISTTGNRSVRVGIFDDNDNLVGSYSNSQNFTVTEPVTQSSPTLSLSSEPVSSVSLGNDYDIRLAANDSDSNLKTVEINWGDSGSTPESFSVSGASNSSVYSHTYSQSGTYTWTAVVKDHTSRTSSTVSRSITVNSIVLPSISSVSAVSPQSAVSGSNFTFRCALSGSLPSGYGVYLNFDNSSGGFLSESSPGGHVSMGTDCLHTAAISTTGNRSVRVGIFDDNDNLVGNYSNSQNFTVTEPVTQSSPTLSLSSEPVSSVALGSDYNISLTANDSDGNLKTVEINWGDNGSTPESFSVSGASNSSVYSHTYSQSGTYTWTAVVKDHTSRISNTISRSITVNVVEPSIYKLSVSIQGGGRVIGSPASIDCDNNCVQDYSAGQGLSLQANASAGWEFSGWETAVSCTSSVICSFTMDNNTTVKAVFTERSEPDLETRLTNFYPKSIPRGQDTLVTFEGVALPATLVVNIHGTQGYCDLVSHSSTKIEMSCNPSVLGDRRLHIKDDVGSSGGISIAGSESWAISVVLPANTAPSVWVDPSYKKYSYVNESYSITAKSWDAENNLKSIQVDWQANGEWNRLADVSNPAGQDIPFSYTPNTAGTLKIRFRATDTNNAVAVSETYTVQIQPQVANVVDSTGMQGGDDSKEQIAEQCEGNPITPANGAKIESRSLLRVNGLAPISFDIQYHSLIRGRSSVGTGWDFANAYAAKITENTNGQVTVDWSENKAHIFNLNDDGSYTPESYGCRLDTLQKLTSGQFRLERSDRKVYLFDEFNFLERIENEKSQGVDFSYNELSQLEKVSDPISGGYIQYSYGVDGYLIQASTSSGRQVSLTYSDGRLSSIIHADGVEEEFTYTDLDQIQTRSLNGDVLSVTSYDEFGRAVEQDDANPNNQTLSFEYTETDQNIVTQVADRNGKQKTMIFDKDYKLLNETDAIGNTKLYEYSDGGKPTTITDGNGNVTILTYNKYGDVTTITKADGTTETREYDQKRNLLKITDAYGKQKKFTYDTNNNLLTSIDELGKVTYFTYDDNNLLLSSTTPEGRTTLYSYTAGLLTAITSPSGNTRYLEYDQDGRLIAESDYLNNYRRYELDELGRKLSETDPLGNLQTWEYDARGNITVYRDAKRNSSSQTADNATREIRHEYSLQGDRVKTTVVYNTVETVWQYRYDGESRLIETIDPNGNSELYERDDLGRVVNIVDALGNTMQKSYDANSNIIKEVDSLNQQGTVSYDSMNRVKLTVDDLGNTVTYSYDALGRLHSMTDALSRFIENGYDALSRLTSVLHPGSLTAKQSFDEDSQLETVTTPSEDTRTLQRDSNANVVDETTADAVSLQYQYNANNQLESFRNGRSQETVYRYDASSRLVLQTDELSDISYSYDENHNPFRVTEKGISIERQYDGFDRVVEYKEDADQQSRIRYELDGLGNLKSLIYPNTLAVSSGFPINYTHDVLNRIETISGFTSGEIAATYEYDNKGRIVKLTRGNGSVLTLTYDSIDRVISSVDQDANGNTIVNQQYTYDAIGRLTEEVVTPESSPPDELIVQVPMTFGAENRLQSKNGEIFDFDGDGNILKAEDVSLQFNVRNQLVQAGDIQYQYNAEGHRIGKTNALTDEQITYVVSPHHLDLVQVLRESTALGVNRDFIYGVQGLLAQYNRNENKHYYFHYDYRGSVIAVSDSQGQVVARYGYLPFGQQYTVSGNFETPFGYNGRDGVVTDENNLIYMRARYYSPSQHRFVSKDPVRGNIANLGSLNRYAYVGGDPINLVDPSGLTPVYPAIHINNDSPAKFSIEEAANILDNSGIVIEKISTSNTGKAAGNYVSKLGLTLEFQQAMNSDNPVYECTKVAFREVVCTAAAAITATPIYAAERVLLGGESAYISAYAAVGVNLVCESVVDSSYSFLDKRLEAGIRNTADDFSREMEMYSSEIDFINGFSRYGLY